MAMNNSLAEVHPELITEWSEKNLPLTPDDITFGSNKKVWWKGACGHEWQTSVKARSSGEKCPICSGTRVIAGINDLATLEPLLVKQWSKKNKIKPTEVSIGSHKKVIWRCEKGHEWEAAVKSRTINKTGCPYCSHNKVLAGFNDLATLLPDIAAEWSDRNYPLLPTQVTVFANRKAWWKCKDCGREWNTLISTRSGGSKCPYCSGYIFSKGFNDLQTTHPEIASEWSEKNLPLKPDEVNAKSRKNVWWRCRKCGNEWKSVINARVKGTVCPVCAEREVLAGYNDLATTDSQLLCEWDYEQNKLKPTEVSRTSAKRAWWKCRHGHSWSMKINERTILNKGCRICEQEYLSLFPALAVSYYSNRKGLKAELGSDRLLGVPLETYIPSEKLAIESGSDDENIEIMKAYMCKQRGIRLIKLPMKGTELDYADSLKRTFQSVHIFISSDKDITTTLNIYTDVTKELKRTDDIMAAVRSLIFIGKVRKDPTTRVLIHEKSSLAPPGETMAFKLGDEEGFRWVGAYEISADELLDGKEGKATETKLERGRKLIRELLADKKEISIRELDEKAKEQGISGRTMRDVRSRMKDELEYRVNEKQENSIRLKE